MNELDGKQFEALFVAILKLKNKSECRDFLRDLCTLRELTAMAERWQVAQLINQGKSYREISKLTGSSTATITRVAQWLKHGTGGYRAVLKRTHP
ncbi:MAG: helix-turn-helix domain-containing protein [Candidatus Kerfeldbacteria bacterium]|nr:helix-turn-helix domain-containing protein [Candidatus Kerfeldbacteria bacterium]